MTHESEAAIEVAAQMIGNTIDCERETRNAARNAERVMDAAAEVKR